jgi:hypothetical protein
MSVFCACHRARCRIRHPDARDVVVPASASVPRPRPTPALGPLRQYSSRFESPRRSLRGRETDLEFHIVDASEEDPVLDFRRHPRPIDPVITMPR